jgi:hypothetical protein
VLEKQDVGPEEEIFKAIVQDLERAHEVSHQNHFTPTPCTFDCTRSHTSCIHPANRCLIAGTEKLRERPGKRLHPLSLSHGFVLMAFLISSSPSCNLRAVEGCISKTVFTFCIPTLPLLHAKFLIEHTASGKSIAPELGTRGAPIY